MRSVISGVIVQGRDTRWPVSAAFARDLWVSKSSISQSEYFGAFAKRRASRRKVCRVRADLALIEVEFLCGAKFYGSSMVTHGSAFLVDEICGASVELCQSRWSVRRPRHPLRLRMSQAGGKPVSSGRDIGSG